MELNPPITSRETEDLIAIANGTPDEWQQDAIDQAKEELNKRGITKEHQQKVLDDWKEEERQADIAYQKQLEINATESYPKWKMVCIFLVAPFIVLGRWPSGPSLWDLKEENYRKKFKQRLVLLVSGLAFWILFGIWSINYLATNDERKRKEEIDKVDISDWKKTYYGADTSSKENRYNDSAR
jgi:hypothetical protein